MSSKSLTFRSASEDDTSRLGAALGEALSDGANVALIGTLGAGKTRLVQAVAVAVGVSQDEATSPTFVLINQYQGRRRLVHVDAYRLRDDDEWLELGLEEYFESDALVFVEWADRFASLLPEDRLEIQIETSGEQSRTFAISATAKTLYPTVESIRASLTAKNSAS